MKTRGSNNGCRIRKDLRLAIYLRDHFQCVYCGRDLHGADPQDITLDHLTCQTNGGNNDPSNLAPIAMVSPGRRQSDTG